MTCECPNFAVKYNMWNYVHIVCIKGYNDDSHKEFTYVIEPECAIRKKKL